MPAKKKKNRKKTRPKAALIASLAVLCALLAMLLAAAWQANTVCLRRAEVSLRDLPREFDGTTILYAADIDLCGVNTAEKTAELFRRLRNLRPDLLLLGGDYTSPPVYEILNSVTGKAASNDGRIAARDRFFKSIADFDAPLGRYILISPDDPDPYGLWDTLTALGLTPMFNSRVTLTKGSAAIDLLGISTDTAPLTSASGQYRSDDCVLACAWSPSVFPKLMITEAADSGRWVDLFLSGHTHGGQISLLGHSVLPLTSQEQKYMHGWSTETGIPILTTSGVGCEGVNLRVGSEAEVWMITLRRKAEE